tara:strand:+ start:828 stop:1088 length:261 start_codon:yes stop_codon:yes gene_type:complete
MNISVSTLFSYTSELRKIAEEGKSNSGDLGLTTAAAESLAATKEVKLGKKDDKKFSAKVVTLKTPKADKKPKEVQDSPAVESPAIA